MKATRSLHEPDGPASVRRASMADAVVLHLVAAATFPLSCPPHTPVSAIQDFVEANLSVERFRGYLAEETRSVFIAEYAGTPAGYSMVSFAGAVPDTVAGMLTVSPSAELCKFYLLAGRHGSGLAERLMEVSIEEARVEGMAGLWLGVHPDNERANGFYEKMNFVARGRKKFQLGTYEEDDLVRELLL